MNSLEQRIERIEYRIELIVNMLSDCLTEDALMCLHPKHECPLKNRFLCWPNILEDEMKGIDTRGGKEGGLHRAEEKEESIYSASVQG